MLGPPESVLLGARTDKTKAEAGGGQYRTVVVRQNSGGSGPDVNFTYRRVSVGFRLRAPLLSRRIDDVSRRPVPAISIPPRPVCLPSSLRWCVLIQSEMGSILMVVLNEFTALPPYVRSI
jgi:hypothetical protein